MAIAVKMEARQKAGRASFRSTFRPANGMGMVEA
jgi:hypothetical protein